MVSREYLHSTRLAASGPVFSLANLESYLGTFIRSLVDKELCDELVAASLNACGAQLVYPMILIVDFYYILQNARG